MRIATKWVITMMVILATTLTLLLGCGQSSNGVTLKEMVNDLKQEGFNIDVFDMVPDDLQRRGALEGIRIKDRGMQVHVIRLKADAKEPFSEMQRILGTELINRSTTDSCILLERPLLQSRASRHVTACTSQVVQRKN